MIRTDHKGHRTQDPRFTIQDGDDLYRVQVALCGIEDIRYSEEYRQQDTKCRKRIINT
jgi:hypothetical protein